MRDRGFTVVIRGKIPIYWSIFSRVEFDDGRPLHVCSSLLFPRTDSSRISRRLSSPQGTPQRTHSQGRMWLETIIRIRCRRSLSCNVLLSLFPGASSTLGEFVLSSAWGLRVTFPRLRFFAQAMRPRRARSRSHALTHTYASRSFVQTVVQE